jgi:hypothetical protein
MKIISFFLSLSLLFSCGIDADKIALSEKDLDDKTTIARYTKSRFNKQSIDTIIFKNPTDPRVLHLDFIHQAKIHLIAYLEETRRAIILNTGGMDVEKGQYMGVYRTDIINNFFIGENRNGEGYKIQYELNKFSKLIYPYPIALDGLEDPLYMKNADKKDMDFAQLAFKDKNLLQVLIALNLYMSQVEYLENVLITEYLLSTCH